MELKGGLERFEGIRKVFHGFEGIEDESSFDTDPFCPGYKAGERPRGRGGGRARIFNENLGTFR